MSALSYAITEDFVASTEVESHEKPFVVAVDVPTLPKATLIEGAEGMTTNLLLATLFDQRFRVVKAIPVEFEVGEDEVAAVWDEIDEFGMGESRTSSCVNLARSIAELYLTLRRESAFLGNDLARVWSILSDHLQYVSAE
jgi:hypothetical protein